MVELTNERRPGKGMTLRPGLVIAIEPMVIGDGSDEYCHAVTADGAHILTN